MAAIISVIVLGSLFVLVGAMMSLSSINEGQMTLESQKRDVSQGLTEACVEEGLIWVNEFDTMPATTIKTSFGTCPVTVNSHVGTSWDFTIGGAVNIKLSRGTTLAVSSWQEL